MDLENGEGPDFVYIGRSWDYLSAFDRDAPTDVCAVWELVGVPEHIACGLCAMWSGLSRVLELGGDVSTQRVSSPGSLPQGDPAAIIGVCTVLLLPTLRIRGNDSASVVGIFADDRMPSR
eukprot:778267-Alexandrium_andersonii.AAC.1